MKKSLLALMTMAVLGSGFATAEEARTEFQWRGHVSPFDTQPDTGWKIVKVDGSKDLNLGVLHFKTTGIDTAEYLNSDQLRFTVVNQDAPEETAETFSYRLEKLDAAVNEIRNFEAFTVKADDGTTLDEDATDAIDTVGSIVGLSIDIDESKVIKNEEGDTGFKPLDTAYAYATIVVESVDTTVSL